MNSNQKFKTFFTTGRHQAECFIKEAWESGGETEVSFTLPQQLKVTSRKA
jgi:hypothetical protein